MPAIQILQIILYVFLSLALLLSIIFLVVGIYVLFQLKKHFKNVAGQAERVISNLGNELPGFWRKILALPIFAYILQKVVRRFL